MARKPRQSAAETRDEILETAERLFTQKSLASVAIADIAAALGMSPANVFKHFQSRAILVDAVVERRLCANTARFLVPSDELTARDQLEQFVVRLLEAHLGDLANTPFLFEIIVEITRSRSAAAERYKTGLKQSLEVIIDAGIRSRRYHCTDAAGAADLVAALLACVLHPVHIARDDKDTLIERARKIVAFIDAALQNNAC